MRHYHLTHLLSVNERLGRYVAFPTLPKGDDVVSAKSTTTGFPHRELPQGGVHSSFLLSCLIDGYLANIGKGVAKVSYADNLAMGAHSDKEALYVLRSLQKTVAQKFGGL